MLNQIKEKLSGDNRANLKNALICGGGHIVTVLSLLITTPLLLHKLGKEGMGIIILAKSLLGMSGMMAFGMGQATLRYVSKYRAKEDHPRLSDDLSTTLTFYGIRRLVGSRPLPTLARPLVSVLLILSQGSMKMQF